MLSRFLANISRFSPIFSRFLAKETPEFFDKLRLENFDRFQSPLLGPSKTIAGTNFGHLCGSRHF